MTPTHTSERRRLTGLAALAAVSAVLAASSFTPAAAADSSGYPGHHRSNGVVANLWSWNWPSIGRECTTQLARKGYAGVQVAPPQDSVKRQHLGDGSDTILHPWWEVYQAVDYALTSRLGSGRQFRDMVSTCRRAGVKVYVDAVVNHTTGQGDTSYGGRHYTHFDYPDAGYVDGDFHHRGEECPSATGGIEDFNNQQQVFNCELVGLADLDTGSSRVRTRIAAYLNKLIRYGVSGFRVDAAKHVGQRDLDAIYARLHDTLDGKRPYWALEVFGGGPGTLSPQAFTRSGDVLGLDGVKQLKAAFVSYPNEHVGSIATLKDFGSRSGLTPGGRTLSFVQNHDTERNGDALSYRDGAINTLATQYLLASGYGRPQVYAGFTFATKDDSPPATTEGQVTDTTCGTGWTCFDRDRAVVGLVRWHNHADDASRHDWRDDGANIISFARGDGWVAFNNNPTAKQLSVQTGIRRGSYCNRVTGCAGPKVKVRPGGRTTVTVPARGAIAIDGGTRR